MTRSQQLRAPRREGFTLIELLVVMAIIAILVSLTTAAVMRAIIQVHQTQVRVEVGQMETALIAFMNDHNVQAVPSSLTLREDMAYPAGDPSLVFLIRAFGPNIGKGAGHNGQAGWKVDWNGDGAANGPWTLDGSQVLVFLIGGIPTTPSGFSNSVVDPSAGTLQPAYFTQFDITRLVPDPGGSHFPRYVDMWRVKPSSVTVTASVTAINTLGGGLGMPYAFFSSNGGQNTYNPGDCSALTAHPYNNGATFVNPNSYQIISAGRDGVFGGTQAGSTTVLWTPDSGTLDTDGKDDQANFAPRILAAGAQ